MEQTVEDLTKKIQQLELQLEKVTAQKEIYENGAAKLYYAQQRKMSEMANVLNKFTLETIDMVSKADATFDRIFKLLEKSESISMASQGLGEKAGITGDEKKDLAKKPFNDRIAEPRF